MLAVIKGAGDIASGIAYRLFKAKISVVMTEISRIRHHNATCQDYDNKSILNCTPQERQRI